MKHLFIINPAAGSRNRTQEYSDVIHKICRARKVKYEIRVSTAPGEATGLPGRQRKPAKNCGSMPAAVTAP